MEPLDPDTRAHMPNGRATCIADPNALLYTGLEQAGSACGHIVIDDAPNRATVTYVCKGRGHGRASVRRTGNNRYIVEAQGISNHAPFDMRGEYRRVADCAERG